MNTQRTFHPCVNIDAENKAISIWLEAVPEYGDWIQHEGADMCLYRAIDDHRVVGARLPLRHFDGSFSVHGLPFTPNP